MIYSSHRELADYNMDTTNSSKELAEALCLAQSEVEAAVKGSTNPHYRNKYADISEIIKTVRHIYNKHGISILQEDSFSDGMAHVHTTFLHKSNASITSKPASCIPAKFDAQGLGAAWTYLRRYALSALCCLAQEDDDGQSASHDRKTEVVKQNPVKSAPVPEPIPVVVYAITDDLIKLRKRMTYLQVNEAAFLTKLGIESISTMPANKVVRANQLLDKKEEEMRNKAAMSMAQTEPA